ncbi:glycosyltransferase family 25 protein [Rubellimicrobium sp. CFH 75288]|uniref:glycosyltransferase family 25 protein n=1 Tax=Rubellimicrobium sp. CFH 75288 TaxID=2697034 RepID=UPI0014128E66|nr:glycosyltransferase family 25 protein [Rubellimicrobium sp. CFH 75288]NAZ36647.1 glycosyl transferase [Rubellimicrobium sp. CFH 75288]
MRTAAAPCAEIRVIHLARAQTRRARLEAQLDRLGLSAAGWGGVDGRDPACAARLAALPDRGPWGALDAHAKGCLLSHLDALAAFLDGPAGHLCVLEDDALIADDLPLWLGDLSWWPPGADLVKIERWRDPRLILVMDRPGRVHRGRQIRRLRSRHSGSAGYLVTRDAARRILAHRPLDLPADHLLFNPAVSPLARGLRIHQVAPALVEQTDDPAAPPPPPRRPRPWRQALRRGAAELTVLAALPRLAAGRAALVRIPWASRAAAPDAPLS